MTDPPRDSLSPEQQRHWYERVIAATLLKSIAEEHWKFSVPLSVAVNALDGMAASDLAQSLAAVAVPVPHSLQTILAPRQLDMLLAAIRNGAGPGTIADLLGITTGLARKYVKDENLVAYGYAVAGLHIPDHLAIVVQCQAVADWLVFYAASVRELAQEEGLIRA